MDIYQHIRDKVLLPVDQEEDSEMANLTSRLRRRTTTSGISPRQRSRPISYPPCTAFTPLSLQRPTFLNRGKLMDRKPQKLIEPIPSEIACRQGRKIRFADEAGFQLASYIEIPDKFDCFSFRSLTNIDSMFQQIERKIDKNLHDITNTDIFDNAFSSVNEGNFTTFENHHNTSYSSGQTAKHIRSMHAFPKEFFPRRSQFTSSETESVSKNVSDNTSIKAVSKSGHCDNFKLRKYSFDETVISEHEDEYTERVNMRHKTSITSKSTSSSSNRSSFHSIDSDTDAKFKILLQKLRSAGQNYSDDSDNSETSFMENRGGLSDRKHCDSTCNPSSTHNKPQENIEEHNFTLVIEEPKKSSQNVKNLPPDKDPSNVSFSFTYSPKNKSEDVTYKENVMISSFDENPNISFSIVTPGKKCLPSEKENINPDNAFDLHYIMPNELSSNQSNLISADAITSHSDSYEISDKANHPDPEQNENDFITSTEAALKSISNAFMVHSDRNLCDIDKNENLSESCDQASILTSGNKNCADPLLLTMTKSEETEISFCKYSDFTFDNDQTLSKTNYFSINPIINANAENISGNRSTLVDSSESEDSLSNVIHSKGHNFEEKDDSDFISSTESAINDILQIFNNVSFSEDEQDTVIKDELTCEKRNMSAQNKEGFQEEPSSFFLFPNSETPNEKFITLNCHDSPFVTETEIRTGNVKVISKLNDETYGDMLSDANDVKTLISEDLTQSNADKIEACDMTVMGEDITEFTGTKIKVKDMSKITEDITNIYNVKVESMHSNTIDGDDDTVTTNDDILANYGDMAYAEHDKANGVPAGYTGDTSTTDSIMLTAIFDSNSITSAIVTDVVDSETLMSATVTDVEVVDSNSIMLSFQGYVKTAATNELTISNQSQYKDGNLIIAPTTVVQADSTIHVHPKSVNEGVIFPETNNAICLINQGNSTKFNITNANTDNNNKDDDFTVFDYNFTLESRHVENSSCDNLSESDEFTNTGSRTEYYMLSNDSDSEINISDDASLINSSGIKDTDSESSFYDSITSPGNISSMVSETKQELNYNYSIKSNESDSDSNHFLELSDTASKNQRRFNKSLSNINSTSYTSSIDSDRASNISDHSTNSSTSENFDSGNCLNGNESEQGTISSVASEEPDVPKTRISGIDSENNFCETVNMCSIESERGDTSGMEDTDSINSFCDWALETSDTKSIVSNEEDISDLNTNFFDQVSEKSLTSSITSEEHKVVDKEVFLNNNHVDPENSLCKTISLETINKSNITSKADDTLHTGETDLKHTVSITSEVKDTLNTGETDVEHTVSITSEVEDALHTGETDLKHMVSITSEVDDTLNTGETDLKHTVSITSEVDDTLNTGKTDLKHTVSITSEVDDTLNTGENDLKHTVSITSEVEDTLNTGETDLKHAFSITSELEDTLNTGETDLKHMDSITSNVEDTPGTDDTDLKHSLCDKDLETSATSCTASDVKLAINEEVATNSKNIDSEDNFCDRVSEISNTSSIESKGEEFVADYFGKTRCFNCDIVSEPESTDIVSEPESTASSDSQGKKDIHKENSRNYKYSYLENSLTDEFSEEEENSSIAQEDFINDTVVKTKCTYSQSADSCLMVQNMTSFPNKKTQDDLSLCYDGSKSEKYRRYENGEGLCGFLEHKSSNLQDTSFHVATETDICCVMDSVPRDDNLISDNFNSCSVVDSLSTGDNLISDNFNICNAQDSGSTSDNHMSDNLNIQFCHPCDDLGWCVLKEDNISTMTSQSRNQCYDSVPKLTLIESTSYGSGNILFNNISQSDSVESENASCDSFSECTNTTDILTQGLRNNNTKSDIRVESENASCDSFSECTNTTNILTQRLRNNNSKSETSSESDDSEKLEHKDKLTSLTNAYQYFTCPALDKSSHTDSDMDDNNSIVQGSESGYGTYSCPDDDNLLDDIQSVDTGYDIQEIEEYYSSSENDESDCQVDSVLNRTEL